MKTCRLQTGLLTLAVLLLSVLVMSACGGGKDPVDTTPTTDTSPASESVVETPPETLPATESESETMLETTTEPETEASATEPETTPIVEPDLTKVAHMSVTNAGYDIYKRVQGNEYGYRYGCTYLYNEDGSVDAYFACIGIVNEQLGMNEWDWISYRHSPDGGKTWEPERIVLTPTNGSQDSYSLCDPGVVYFGGYYYLAYTSTL